MVKRSKTKKIAAHQLEHVALGVVQTRVYQRGKELAIVVLYGDWHGADFVPVRLQSACAYGEILGAADCDCRSQLEESFNIFDKSTRGILIHLNQEGRGAGLAVKAKAYELQQREDLDTVEAYERLGVLPDQRRYEIAAGILHDLRVRQVKLLTNNPRKIAQLSRHREFVVTREPLVGAMTRHNQAYLTVKQGKLGHDLGLGVG